MENYAYYGSGLVLDEAEFARFMERYLKLNKLTKEQLVKETWGDSCQEALRYYDIEKLYLRRLLLFPLRA